MDEDKKPQEDEKLTQEIQRQIQELQSHEQILQNVLMQKQAFQVEFNETEIALTELEKTEQDVFKIIGSIIIKSTKNDLKQELEKKKELISVRLKSLEEQEQKITDMAEKLRNEIMSKLK